MLRNPFTVAIIVSCYLFIYTVLLHSGVSLSLAGVLFFISPFMIVWMVYTVLRHGKYEGIELKEQEEWGYSDKKREDLGTF